MGNKKDTPKPNFEFEKSAVISKVRDLGFKATSFASNAVEVFHRRDMAHAILAFSNTKKGLYLSVFASIYHYNISRKAILRMSQYVFIGEVKHIDLVNQWIVDHITNALFLSNTTNKLAKEQWIAYALTSKGSQKSIDKYILDSIDGEIVDCDFDD